MLKRFRFTAIILLLFFTPELSIAQRVDLFGDSIQVQKGSIGELKIDVSGFSGISGIQGTMAFDTSELSFVGFGSFAALQPSLGAANFNFSNATNGWISFLWSDPNLRGANLADSSLLYSLFFRAKGSVGILSKVHFIDTPTRNEVSDTTLSTRTHNFDSLYIRILPAGNQNIVTNSSNSLIYCAGDSVVISYSAVGTFGLGNTFKLELSDTAGAFVSPRIMAFGKTALVDTFRFRLPRDLTFGKAYRMRVSSSTPLVFGSDNGSNITIYELPIVSFLQKIQLCETDSPLMLSGGSPIGGTYSGPGVSNNRFDPKTAGVGDHEITYSFTNANSCTSSAMDTFKVFARPAKPIVSRKGDTLSTNVLNGNQWFLNGVSILGATGQDYVALINGLYSVIVINGPCVSDTSEIIKVNTATQKVFESKIKLYPNPTKRWVIIEYTQMELDLNLIDLNGRVLARVLSVQSGEKIDLSDLEAGVYLLKMESSTATIFKKIIITK